jgi:hypothetical protein
MTSSARNSKVYLLFIIPYFALRITYGSDNAYIDLNLGWIQIAIGAYSLLTVQYNKASVTAILTHITVFGLILLHLLFATLTNEVNLIGDEEALFQFIRLYIYMFISLFVITNIQGNTANIIFDCFFTLSKVCVWFALAFFLLMEITGVHFLLNNYGSGGWIRAQALMTEPSGLAAPVALVLAVGIRRRQLSLFVLGCAGAFVSQSAVVVVISCLIGLISFYRSIHPRYKKTVICLFILFLGLGSLLWLSVDCAGHVASEQGSLIIENLVANRAICGTREILQFQNSGEPMTNMRFIYNLTAFEYLNEIGALFTGQGLGVGSVLFRRSFDGIAENSFLVTIYLSFGLFGFAIVSLILLTCMKLAKNISEEFLLFYLTLMFGAVLNSAGGFYNYIILILCVYVLLLSNRDPRTNNMSREALLTMKSDSV